MAKTFGEYIRSKRQEKMLRLKSFAKQIGISNVYLSYIESGKRPAPSQPILQRISAELQLNPDEESHMYLLAKLSHRRSNLPEDVWDYVTSRPYVYETLCLAAKNNVSEDQWAVFRKIIDMKKKSPSSDKRK